MAGEAERILEFGFLPKELPFEFTSADLKREFAAIQTALQALPLKAAEAEVFSLARGGHARRTLRIPNPLHYFKQSAIIGSHWASIKKITDSSQLSLSKPNITIRGGRATRQRPAGGDLAESRLIAIADKRYVLQTDFARFFASIYTHSIPWALHGKAKAKRNRKVGGAYFGNDIDKAIRDGQDGQTVGIPVGPDSSHIISELIAASVDGFAFPAKTSGYRYVDDYFLCFSSESEALSALDRLALAARHYEIDLNYSKTTIRRVEEVMDSLGLDELRDFSFANKTSVSRKELHALFSLASRLGATEENALKYAIRMLAQRAVLASDWQIFESYLLRSGTLSPNALDVIAFSLYRHALKGAPLNRERITNYFADIIVSGTLYNFHSNVVWALWAFKVLNYQVPERATKALPRSDNSAVALLALDLRERGQLAGTLSVSLWSTLLTNDGLYGEHWLLVYESIKKGWLAPKTPVLAADPLFAVLDAHDIEFYHEDRTENLTNKLRSRPAADGRSYNIGAIKWFLLAIDPVEPVGAADHAEPALTQDGIDQSVAADPEGERRPGLSSYGEADHQFEDADEDEDEYDYWEY